jgi:hypothetical protein
VTCHRRQLPWRKRPGVRRRHARPPLLEAEPLPGEIADAREVVAAFAAVAEVEPDATHAILFDVHCHANHLG